MIFLTGGTGMLGAHVLHRIAARGEKVKALKRPNSDLSQARKIFAHFTPDHEKSWKYIEWIDGDLMDKESLRKALKGATTVIHAAARVSFDPRDKKSMLQENETGTANITEAAMEAGIQQFVHVSSIATLGEGGAGYAVTEELSWKNDRKRSAYSESKFLAEMEVWRAIEEGLPCVILNPSVILGAGNWQQGSPRLFATAAAGMKYYTDGATGFVDVEDVAELVLLSLERDNFAKLMNRRWVVSAENIAYRDLFTAIAALVKRPAPSVRAGKLLLEAGWRASCILARLTGKAPALTGDTARSANRTAAYDGSRIAGILDFQYRPIPEVLDAIAGIYLAEHPGR